MKSTIVVIITTITMTNIYHLEGQLPNDDVYSKSTVGVGCGLPNENWKHRQYYRGGRRTAWPGSKLSYPICRTNGTMWCNASQALPKPMLNWSPVTQQSP